MSSQTLPAKDPAERVIVDFDFSLDLDTAEYITGTPAVGVALVAGTDPSPAAILLGTPTVAAGVARQAIIGGVAGATYRLRCAATLDSGRILVLAANLPVRTA
jgi:hypothetical protein